MRSEGLIKRIATAFTAVTVFASIGLTTFAAGEVTGYVNVAETAAGSGLYNVAINYDNSASSTVGVTMLAYADEADGRFEESDIPAGYDDTGMQIVGFDQSSDTSSGTFNFLVDTNKTSDTDAIRMDKGDVGIVLLSADGAAAPTGYLFAIPEDVDPTFTVTSAKVFMNAEEVTTVQVDYGTTSDQILEMLNSGAVEVKVYGENDAGTQEEAWDVNWTLDSNYSATTPDTYTVTGTLIKPDGANGVLADVTEVTGYVEVKALEWEITQGTLADVNITIDQSADVLAAVKAELMNGSKVINATDADAETNYTAAIVMTPAIANTVVSVENSTYKVTVADNSLVENESPADSLATIVSGGFDVTFNVNVAYNPTGKFEATRVEARDANNQVVTKVEVDNGTSETLAIDALKAKVAKATVYGIDDTSSEASEDWTVTGWTIEDYDAETAGNYTATATLQAPDNALATVPGTVTLTVTVTVKAAAAPPASNHKRGDVNCDGDIGIGDVASLKQFMKGLWMYTDFNAADVNNDGDVGIGDVASLKQYMKGSYNIPE